MAIIVSIVFSLITGVAFMYKTEYFWGKESNSNINTLNCTLNNMSDTFGVNTSFNMLIIVVIALAAIVMLCTTRGF